MSEPGERRHLVELLPWLLNGTLSAEEEAEVREALAGDEELRQALHDAAGIGDAFAAAPDSAALVDFAAGRTSDEARRAIEAHLEAHPADRQLVEMARASLATAEEEPSEASARSPAAAAARSQQPSTLTRPSRAPWMLALAASLVAVVALTGWQQASRHARLLTESVSTAPLAPLPIVELVPDRIPRRGSGAAPPPASVGDERVALLLVTSLPEPYEAYVVELRDEEGTTLWRQEELEPQPGGTFSLILDPRRLGDRPAELRLLGVRQGLEETVHSYRLRR